MQRRLQKSQFAKRARQKRRGKRNAWSFRWALSRVYERYAAELLQPLVEHGLLRAAFPTRRGGYWDRRKTDVIIVDREREQHRLQVKSSEFAAENFREENPDVPVF